jgi:hypothetical protein
MATVVCCCSGQGVENESLWRTTHENMNALAIWPDRRRVSALAKVVRAMILCTVQLV